MWGHPLPLAAVLACAAITGDGLVAQTITVIDWIMQMTHQPKGLLTLALGIYVKMYLA